jgi:hypothetical protein
MEEKIKRREKEQSEGLNLNLKLKKLREDIIDFIISVLCKSLKEVN